MPTKLASLMPPPLLEITSRSMNRKIAFRAWDTEEKVMRDADDTGDGRAIPLNRQIAQLQERGFILLQFTGLLDKNGKEIYEGDIVRISKRVKMPQIVGYIEDEACFGFVYDSGEPMRNINPSEIPLLEVIGNLYENPELLTPTV